MERKPTVPRLSQKASRQPLPPVLKVLWASPGEQHPDALLQMQRTEKRLGSYLVFLQTQVWSGHSLCPNHVGSSVPRIRPPPWVVYKDPSLSVPDYPSVSLNPFLPSLWYPVHAHLPTTGLWTWRFLPQGLCTCQRPRPRGSFTHSVPGLFLIIIQQSAQNFLLLISLL